MTPRPRLLGAPSDDAVLRQAVWRQAVPRQAVQKRAVQKRAVPSDVLTRIVLTVALACFAFVAPSALAQIFDPAHTRIGFELYTRWGQRLQGRFPRYEGEVRTLPDGRQQVTMRLSTADVEIVGYPRYTEFTRGRRFFDAARHPWVSFTSDPYPPSLLREGGALAGVLRIHGTSQHETFTVEPAACASPATGCDLVARGSVRREDYGMDDWKWAVSGRVRFELRLRLRQVPGP